MQEFLMSSLDSCKLMIFTFGIFSKIETMEILKPVPVIHESFNGVHYLCIHVYTVITCWQKNSVLRKKTGWKQPMKLFANNCS